MLSTIAKPFGWLLMWLYEVVGNYGLAVVLFALIVKLILLPFQMKSKRSMMRTTGLQDKMKELEKKHGANKQKYNEEVAKLYKDEGVNPMSGCLWSLLPFPILIALYQAIRYPLTIMMGVPKALIEEGGAILEKLTSLGFESSLNSAYAQIDQAQFITNHFDEFSGITDKLTKIDYNLFGIDLGAVPQWQIWQFDWSQASEWLPAMGLFLIPVIAAALTYLSSKITQSSSGQQTQQSSMMIMMPIMTLVFAFMMPAALGIYWAASTFFGIIQDIWLTKRYTKQFALENADKYAAQRAKEEELEAKRKETERLKAENAMEASPATSKKKQQLQEKLEKEERRAEWERQHAAQQAAEKAEREAAEEASRSGNRKFARGRAYDPDRFADRDDNGEKYLDDDYPSDDEIYGTDSGEEE